MSLSLQKNVAACVTVWIFKNISRQYLCHLPLCHGGSGEADRPNPTSSLKCSILSTGFWNTTSKQWSILYVDSGAGIVQHMPCNKSGGIKLFQQWPSTVTYTGRPLILSFFSLTRSSSSSISSWRLQLEHVDPTIQRMPREMFAFPLEAFLLSSFPRFLPPRCAGAALARQTRRREILLAY